ncbi:MAG: rod shape-determining protein MreC [Spirochaetes bacterium]|nr:rod shape-determining protein MreC [Spirochaetota bacterium]
MPRNRRGRGFSATHGIPLLLLLFSVILISIATKEIVKFPSAIASTVAGTAQRVFSVVGGAVGRMVFAIGELSDLRNQYDSLAAKMESYSNMEREYTDMKAENDRLKEQLDVSRNLTAVITSARIIAKDPGNIYSSYVIDKGEGKGLVKDQAVAAFQNGMEGLVGRTLDVWGSTSLILPLFDQRFFVSARLSRTRTEGLVNGGGGPDAALEMRYLSKLNASEVQIGDLVVTSGLDSIYPADLAIGRVKAINLPEYSSSAVILLEPSLDFAKLEYLFVLKKVSTETAAQSTENTK